MNESIDQNPRVDIEFILAATKAADIGFKIEVAGNPSAEQIEGAVAKAEQAFRQMIMARRRMMALRDEPAPDAGK